MVLLFLQLQTFFLAVNRPLESLQCHFRMISGIYTSVYCNITPCNLILRTFAELQFSTNVGVHCIDSLDLKDFLKNLVMQLKRVGVFSRRIVQS